jgi:hypothetical protein
VRGYQQPPVFSAGYLTNGWCRAVSAIFHHIITSANTHKIGQHKYFYLHPTPRLYHTNFVLHDGHLLTRPTFFFHMSDSSHTSDFTGKTIDAAKGKGTLRSLRSPLLFENVPLRPTSPFHNLPLSNLTLRLPPFLGPSVPVFSSNPPSPSFPRTLRLFPFLPPPPFLPPYPLRDHRVSTASSLIFLASPRSTAILPTAAAVPRWAPQGGWKRGGGGLGPVEKSALLSPTMPRGHRFKTGRTASESRRPQSVPRSEAQGQTQLGKKTPGKGERNQRRGPRPCKSKRTASIPRRRPSCPIGPQAFFPFASSPPSPSSIKPPSSLGLHRRDLRPPPSCRPAHGDGRLAPWAVAPTRGGWHLAARRSLTGG